MKPEIIIKVANYYYKMYALDYDWNMKLCETRNVISKISFSLSKFNMIS